MANTSALKKGLPPKRGNVSNVIASNSRTIEEKNKPLQVMIPPDVFNDFSAHAGKVFGFSKGAKSQLFLEIWQKYSSMKT